MSPEVNSSPICLRVVMHTNMATQRPALMKVSSLTVGAQKHRLIVCLCFCETHVSGAALNETGNIGWSWSDTVRFVFNVDLEPRQRIKAVRQ